MFHLFDEISVGLSRDDPAELNPVAVDQAHVFHKDIVDAPSVAVASKLVADGKIRPFGGLHDDVHAGIILIHDFIDVFHFAALVKAHLVDVVPLEEFGEHPDERLRFGDAKGNRLRLFFITQEPFSRRAGLNGFSLFPGKDKYF